MRNGKKTESYNWNSCEIFGCNLFFLFFQAIKLQPCVIFIDEIGKHKGFLHQSMRRVGTTMQSQASQLVLKRDIKRKNIVLIVKDSRYDIHIVSIVLG